MGKKLLWGLLAVVILIVLALAYVNFIYLPKNLKPLFISFAEQALEKEVQVEAAEYVPFKGISFSGVSVFNPDGSPFIRVSDVSVSLASLPRVGPGGTHGKVKFVLSKAEYNSAEAAVRADAKGELAINSSGDFHGIVFLEHTDVRPPSPLAEITGIRGRIELLPTAVFSEALIGRAAGEDLELSFRLEKAEGGLILNKLTLVYPGSTVTVSGRMETVGVNPRVDAEGTALIDAASFLRLLPGLALPPLEAVSDVRFNASGPMDPLLLTGEAEINSSNIQAAGINCEKLDVKLKLDKGRMVVPAVRAELYGGTVDAFGEAEIKPGFPGMVLAKVQSLELRGLLLDLLSQDLGEGKVFAEFEAAGRLMEPDSLAGTSSIKVEEAGITLPAVFRGISLAAGLPELKSAKIVSAQGDFKLAKGRFTTENLQALTSPAIISAVGWVDLDLSLEMLVSTTLKSESLRGRLGVSKLPDVRITGRFPQLKYDPLIMDAAEDFLREKLKNEFKEKSGEQLKSFLEKVF